MTLDKELTRFFAMDPSEYARNEAIKAIGQGTATAEQITLIRARLTAHAENGRGIPKRRAKELLTKL